MFQQLRREILKTTEDLLREEREEKGKKGREMDRIGGKGMEGKRISGKGIGGKGMGGKGIEEWKGKV